MEISFTETWRSLGYHGDKVHRIVMDLWVSKEIDFNSLTTSVTFSTTPSTSNTNITKIYMSSTSLTDTVQCHKAVSFIQRVSANLAADYPTQDKDGSVLQVSSHPVVAAIALVFKQPHDPDFNVRPEPMPSLSSTKHSRLILQTVAAINYSNLRSRRPEIGWGPYSGVKSTSFDFTLDAIRSGRTYANGNNRPITREFQKSPASLGRVKSYPTLLGPACFDP
ncbi:hypothetical protein BU17DRAFT_68543 [Hysterangium stoloniferum]|nr:hypothetical protein BU17DRAFT_68543 [Hysterangium stoloniferum]